MINPIQLNTIKGPEEARSAPPNAGPQGSGFASVFREALEQPRPVRFSAHAFQRLRDRNIEFTASDHGRIAEALDQAEAKGARDSLLLMGRLALVVSVPNRTVITVLEPNAGETTVFTNIDSVVVVVSEEASSHEQRVIGLDPGWGGPAAADR